MRNEDAQKNAHAAFPYLRHDPQQKGASCQHFCMGVIHEGALKPVFHDIWCGSGSGDP